VSRVADIQLHMQTNVLVMQGAMGTTLQQMGFEGCLPELNLLEPETVEDLHARYRGAGADVGIANTFCATSANLAPQGFSAYVDQINVRGVELARSAGFAHVLGSVGPCGVVAEEGSGRAALAARGATVPAACTASGPAPRYQAAVELYAEQAAALASAGPDGILVETFTDVDDALAAVEGARRATDLPVIVTLSLVGEDLGRAAEYARLLEDAGAAAVGTNCMDVESTLRATRAVAAVSRVPVVARPSAGTPRTAPDGSPVWPLGAAAFADVAVELLRAGARVVGSCCGSTPACTGALFGAVGGLELPER
jgi:methionine synthase I (cobalamin-dependent)